jgi:DnaJ family protein C protein 11
VTIAVAALVGDHDEDDGGRLVIPAGLRKSRLLGFWDPAPGRTKVLRVRYLWRGEEREVEVCGREELRLP